MILGKLILFLLRGDNLTGSGKILYRFALIYAAVSGRRPVAVAK
jgi:hypothetical protein